MDAESEFWVIFTIFSKYQPFSAIFRDILAEIVDILGIFKICVLSLSRPPSTIIWTLNPNLNSFLYILEVSAFFSHFLAVCWLKMADFLKSIYDLDQVT